jgi:hypothetical protein
MKATMRIILPLIICMIVVSIATSVCLSSLLNYISDIKIEDMIEFNESTDFEISIDSEQSMTYGILSAVTVILFIIFIGIMVASVISVFALMARRFYTSFFTDEGYLTFTLPVTTDCHLLTKTASMFIWNIANYAAIILSFGILFIGIYAAVPEFFVMDDYTKMYLEEIFASLGATFGGAITFSVIELIISSIASCLLLFFAISVGCMIAKKYRLIACVASYFIISGIVSEIIGIITGIVSSQFIYLEATAENSNLLVMAVLLISTFLYVAQGVGCYFGTRWILKNKINLD